MVTEKENTGAGPERGSAWQNAETEEDFYFFSLQKKGIPLLDAVDWCPVPVEHSSQKLTGTRGSYPDQVKGFSNS